MNPIGLAALPPIVIALVALAAAFAWQLAGTLAMLRLTPDSFSRIWRFTLAWFLWLPISGAAVLAMVLTGIAGRTALVAGTIAVVALAAASAHVLPPLLADARAAWTRWSSEASASDRWLLRVGLLLQVIIWVFAAHPQRHYDQLNYHLVVGHLVVRDGQPFTGATDPHVSFSGIVDYAFAWHQSWTQTPLLCIAMAQVAVMLATVPVLIICALWLGGPSLGLLGMLFVSLPAIVPESTMLRMAKPDGFILTGVMLLLTLLLRTPEGWPFLALALALLLGAAKITMAHAALSLAAVALVVRPLWGRVRDWWPLLAVGASAEGLQLWKNARVFGNPFYPAGAAVFPSPWSDESTRAYWEGVAYQWQSHFSGLVGPLVLVRWAGPLFFCLAVALLAVAWGRHRRRDPPENGSLRPALVFLGVYWAAWPLFYGSHISARFVGGFTAAILVLTFLLLGRLRSVDRRGVLIACSCAALFDSMLDQSVPYMRTWNKLSAWEAFNSRWPTMRTATALNVDLLPTDTVVADRAEKFFFDANLLSDTPLAPQERAILAELRQDPSKAALRYRVKALVVEDGKPMSAVMSDIWRGLEAQGASRRIGGDRVLESPCYFGGDCAPPAQAHSR